MTFWTGLRDAVLSYYCVSTALAGNAYDIFSPIFSRALNLPPGLASPVIDWLTLPRQSICNDRPDYRGQSGPGYERAQCPTIYKVYYTLNQYDGSGFLTRTDTAQGSDLLWGPIERPIQAKWVNGPGSVIAVSFYGYGSGYGPRQSAEGEAFVNIAPYNQNSRSFEIVDLSYIRADGLPDDCGDPPITIPPPVNNYNIHDVDIVYNDNGGNQITVPVVLIYGQAFVDADFNVQVPVEISITPQLSISANVNVQTGDVKFNIAPTIDLSGGTYSIGSRYDNRTTNNTNNFSFDSPPPPPPPGAESGDKEPPPQPDQERLIRGVIVTVTATSGHKEGVLFQPGGNPDIYIPNLGFVQFAIRINNAVSWTSDQPVKSLRSFIPCLWEGGAVDVQGTPSPGVTWTLTPVYGRAV